MSTTSNQRGKTLRTAAPTVIASTPSVDAKAHATWHEAALTGDFRGPFAACRFPSAAPIIRGWLTVTKQMERLVIYIINGHAKGAAGDIATRRDSASEALAVACNYLKSGMDEVSIRDGEGHHVSGADLQACCRGEKSLTGDLRAF